MSPAEGWRYSPSIRLYVFSYMPSTSRGAEAVWPTDTSMTCLAAAPLELLPTATRAGIIPADAGDPPRRPCRRCGNGSENRSAQVGVFGQGLWKDAQHRFGQSLERFRLPAAL